MWRLCFKDGRQLGRCRHSTRLCKPNCASIQISQPFWNYGLFSSSLGYTNIPACSQWAVLFLPSTASPEGPRDTLLFCSNGAERSSTAVLEAFVIGPGAAILLVLRHSTLVYWSMFHNVSSYFCSSIESKKNQLPLFWGREPHWKWVPWFKPAILQALGLRNLFPVPGMTWTPDGGTCKPVLLPSSGRLPGRWEEASTWEWMTCPMPPFRST